MQTELHVNEVTVYWVHSFLCLQYILQAKPLKLVTNFNQLHFSVLLPRADELDTLTCTFSPSCDVQSLLCMDKWQEIGRLHRMCVTISCSHCQAHFLSTLQPASYKQVIFSVLTNMCRVTYQNLLLFHEGKLGYIIWFNISSLVIIIDCLEGR